MPVPKTVIVIAGPTAVGKTTVAIAIAKAFETEIISADSRQCYSELNIGVARPSVEELDEVPHHFIASHSIHQKVTAAVFENYALQKVHGLLKKFDVVVMTGGTGLYIKAFCEGLDAIPDVPEAVRLNITANYKQNGLAWLQEEVKRLDPLFSSQGEMQNPQRLMRALEVMTATGKSIESFKKKNKANRDFQIIKTALQLPKEGLHHNINTRTDAMFANGLVEEVNGLIPYKDLNALQTVGYKEVFDFFDGRYRLHDAMERIKIHTRQYAKRQLTWFRNAADYTWFPPQAEAVMQYLKSLGY